MKRILVVLSTLTLAILWFGLGSVFADTITLLDTFPTTGPPFTTSLPVYSSFEWQELAIPFHLPEAGWITHVDTDLLYDRGITPL